jgi:hypothetical protein
MFGPNVMVYLRELESHVDRLFYINARYRVLTSRWKDALDRDAEYLKWFTWITIISTLITGIHLSIMILIVHV